ncbi:MAG: M28 family peptidase [Gammaproteobacteria bacterium]|nr:M28 family peptidase [Gammaproteobacteria bacterium]MDH5727997.1 M28 family peptidase [Gammaproteobacteria bacterium]
MSRLILIIFSVFASQQAFSSLKIGDVYIDQSYLKKVVTELSVNIGARNFDQSEGLEKASRYIVGEFEKQGHKVVLQKYVIEEIDEVENIIVSLGPKDAERIVVGAHYDTYRDQPGADDNASGVAGLLALAGFLKKHESNLKRRIDFVAYTLEEPPFFRSEFMGSYIHAKSLKDNNIDVLGMISLEMIGYYSNKENSQEYPLGLMKIMYPTTGDFIGVVSNVSSNGLKSQFAEYLAVSSIPVETLSAPSWLVGVDFSDHLNYWQFGYDAIMVTDTAFYRNANYHQKTDIIETLNFKLMAEVIRGVSYGLFMLANK